jgi:hypothetical protein
VADDDERVEVRVDLVERFAHAHEHVAEHLRRRLGDRVLVARVDDRVARPGEVLDPGRVEARLRRAPAVQEQHERQRALGARALHDGHAPGPLAAAQVDELAAGLALQPGSAAARQQRGEDGGERPRAHRYS